MQKKAILNLNRRDKPVSQAAWVIFLDSSRHSALAIDKSEPSNSLLNRDNLSDLPPSHVQLRHWLPFYVESEGRKGHLSSYLPVKTHTSNQIFTRRGITL